MCLHTTNTADDIKTPASFEVRWACVCSIFDDTLQKGVFMPAPSPYAADR